MNRRRIHGQCPACGQPVRTAQRVGWVAGRGWCHVACQRSRSGLRGLAAAIDRTTAAVEASTAATIALTENVRTANNRQTG